ncbi:MAG: T9SS type A sorting domain-containing protein [Bacteroidetes bacterium]|nr:T9SS type A sorting domain-containing protein [Bacteroidota bacterium]
MKKALLFFCLLFWMTNADAQFHGVYDGVPNDSCTFSFEPSDSLNHTSCASGITDTSGCNLWRIGSTSKPYFTIGSSSKFAIMTDTSSPYPLKANDYFIIKNIKGNDNIIYSFYHKYQTRKNKDGGMVEYSLDTGKTWENVKLGCNNDSTNAWGGILTSNFYTRTDTIATGEPCFTGSSNGWQYSRFQFFWGFPIKITGTFNCIVPIVWVRFRFVSDSIPDTLDGWIIDSIKIEHDRYYGSVKDFEVLHSLPVYPNPSTGLINFPVLFDEKSYKISITTITGLQILELPYNEQVDLSSQPNGMYFYKVSNGQKIYTGKIQLE